MRGRRAIVATLPDEGFHEVHNHLRRIIEKAGYTAISCMTMGIAQREVEVDRVDCLIVDSVVAPRWELLVKEAKENNESAGVAILCANKDEVDDVAEFGTTSGYRVTALEKFSRSFVVEFEQFLNSLRKGAHSPQEATVNDCEIFVIHAVDNPQMARVVGILRTLHTDPFVLCLEATDGLTLAEQIEAASNVKLAIAIVTADDPCVQPDGDIKMRPRQNVIFEFGFFVGRLGRKGVVCLKESGVDLPSDLHGVRYLSLDMADIELRIALAQALGKAKVEYRL